MNHDSDNIAINGFDPVAYFMDAKPMKGSPKFTSNWHGAVWLFRNAEHRDLFAGNPDRFAPQYGGFCAYGVSEGHTVDVDPEAWKIIGGKLYMNYNKIVQQKFVEEADARIRRADENWPGLHN